MDWKNKLFLEKLNDQIGQRDKSLLPDFVFCYEKNTWFGKQTKI